MHSSMMDSYQTFLQIQSSLVIMFNFWCAADGAKGLAEATAVVTPRAVP